MLIEKSILEVAGQTVGFRVRCTAVMSGLAGSSNADAFVGEHGGRGSDDELAGPLTDSLSGSLPEPFANTSGMRGRFFATSSMHLFRMIPTPWLCAVLLLLPATDAPVFAQVANNQGVAGQRGTSGSEGWPDATNTGVPSGVTLTSSGDLAITKAGTVVSDIDITGTVQINAPNVTLKNCKVTAGAWSVVKIASGVTGTVIQNCEINGRGSSGAEGSCGINGQGTFLDNNIYNVENGINVTGSSVIRGNYIHGLLAPGSPHYDGIQIDGGVSDVTINHNTVINDQGGVSAIMIDNGFGPISNILVEDNRLIGGGFTVYSDGQFKDAAITGVAFVNNRLRKGHWGYHSFVKNAPIWRGNVNDDTGRPLLR